MAKTLRGRAADTGPDLGLSVAHRVAEHLEREILAGKIAPGEWLREIELARTFGISRTPLREAFHILEANGLLTIVPRKGARVKTVSDAEMLSILQVRLALDGLAAELAARNRDSRLPGRFGELIEAQRRAIARNRVTRFHELGQELHARIYAAAGNPKLEAIFKALQVDGALHRISTLVLPGEMDAAFAEHREIAEAIEGGDAERARRAAEAHIRRTLHGVQSKTRPRDDRDAA